MENENENMGNKILVADDSPEISDLLNMLLGDEGFNVDIAVNVQEVVDKLTDTTDLVILDVMIPEKEGEEPTMDGGFKACEIIRQKSKIPILFLTAKGQIEDKERGFNIGGDDYIVKPFSYVELISRVKALIRRYLIYKGKETEYRKTLTYKNITINFEMQSVTVDGKEVNLTVTEYNILVLLVKNKGKIFSAEAVYENIWREEYYYNANNTIMVHILKLRKKVEKDYKNPEIIKTAWGKGYYVE